MVLPGSGAGGGEPAGLREGGGGGGITLGSHKLCNARLSFLYGCEKDGGRGGLGRPGGSGGEGVFFAVPNCLGFGTANLLTHMSLLPRD